MKNTKSAIVKGRMLENYVADQIAKYGLDDKATRSVGSGSGNREKSDIDTTMKILDLNAGIECKNQKKLSIPDWWKQTLKLQDLGCEPVLVFKIFGESLSNTKAIIYYDTLLKLIQKSYIADDKVLVTQLDPIQGAKLRNLASLIRSKANTLKTKLKPLEGNTELEYAMVNFKKVLSQLDKELREYE